MKRDCKIIDRCYDCSQYSEYLSNCLIKRIEIENPNIIPDWCPLDDAWDGKL